MRAENARLLLLVMSDAAERRRISAFAVRAGWSVVGAADPVAAAAMLDEPRANDAAAVLLGQWSRDDGPRWIANLRRGRTSLPVIVLDAHDGNVDAVEAIRAGADDFLAHPLAAERLADALAAHCDRRRAAGELAPLSDKLARPMSLDSLVGAAPGFRSALAIAAKAARSRLPIHILGEPGSGKKTLARAIHLASPRTRGPFLEFDCKATSAATIDSELFGHAQGAFPGAFADRVGRLVEADGGSLLLSEIGALPRSTQAALEQVLATGEVRPLGCNGSNSIDVRLLATATRPLPDSFDPHLRERIMATMVALPPLRERSGDIPALARHLMARIAEQPGMRPLSIGNDGLAVLMRYGWPGNVRQLGAVLFRAALQCAGGGLTAEHFPHIAIQSRFTGRASDRSSEMAPRSRDEALAGSSSITLFGRDGHLRPLDDIEGDVIRLAIGHYRGRMTEVARRLGIGRSTLYRKLGELGIDSAA